MIEGETVSGIRVGVGTEVAVDSGEFDVVTGAAVLTAGSVRGDTVSLQAGIATAINSADNTAVDPDLEISFMQPLKEWRMAGYVHDVFPR
jgi:hypothetical protein